MINYSVDTMTQLAPPLGSNWGLFVFVFYVEEILCEELWEVC